MLPFRRVRTIVATGFICVFVAWSGPARSQEAELKLQEAPIEATLDEGADPEKAVTTEDPTIPVDQLQLLLKPFTLEELRNEAAAWLVLLKGKVQEVSNLEIAIKRENQAIDAEEEAASEIETAQASLEEAEQAQKNATPGSPEYEEATKKVEEAREALQKAQDTVEEAIEAKAKLKESEALKEVLKEAQKDEGIEDARKVLEQAEKDREEIPAGSLNYQRATEKINALEEAIANLEKAEEDQKAANPDSPEYQEVTKQVEQARAEVTKAQAAIANGLTNQVEEQPEATPSPEGSEQASPTEEQPEATPSPEGSEQASPTEEQPEATPLQDVDLDALDTNNLQNAGEKLEETAEQLEESAAEGEELKNRLLVNVTELQSDRTAVIDRFKVVLDEVDAKGGDSRPYRQYIEAVSGVELDLTDTEGLGVRVLSWVTSEEGGLRWGRNVGMFIAIMIAATVASRVAGKITNTSLERFSDASEAFRHFVVTVVKRVVMFVGLLMALAALEVSLGPVLALLGGASFILAFALQNSIGNFANGLLLMAYKPFDVGDEIEVDGILGEVDAISLVSTKLKTFGEQIVTIPNNTVWSSTVTNNTALEVRAVGPTVKACDTSIEKIEAIFADIFKTHPLIQEEDSYIYPWDFEESSVIFEVRAYTETKNRWEVYEQLLFVIQERFKKEGIAIGVTQDLYVTYTPDLSKKTATPELDK